MYQKRTLIRDIVKVSLVGALYFVLVQVFAFMSYQMFQVRIAEFLVLLCFYNRKYTYGLVIGCFFANLLGVYGIVDAFVGSLATLIACLLVSSAKNLWLASLALPFANILVVLEIVYIEGYMQTAQYGLVFLTLGMVLLGELIAGTVIGVPIFKLLEKRPATINLIKN